MEPAVAATIIAALIQTVAILAAAFIAAQRASTLVSKQIRQHDSLAKSQVTWDTILRHQHAHPDWMVYSIAARETAQLCRTNQLKIPADLSTLDLDDQQRIRTTITYLNYYELIAHGLTQDTLDIDSYRHWCETGYRTTFKDMQPFICQWRDSKPPRKAGWTEFEHWAKPGTSWTQQSVRDRKKSQAEPPDRKP